VGLVTAPLFELAAVPPRPQLSRDRRRTERQRAAVVDGLHPLSVALGVSIPLHPEAAPVDDRAALGRRCGTCWFRTLIGYPRAFPKCSFGWSGDRSEQPPRMTHGAGTDVRRWWPACADYSAGDPGLSPDAARWIPPAGGESC
jgi:hypothetical protein